MDQNLIRKITDNGIFPNGEAQKIKELNELKLKLSKEYPDEYLNKAYYQASYIFYTSANRYTFYTSPLILTQNYVDIDDNDAWSIYDFLWKKFIGEDESEYIGYTKSDPDYRRLFCITKNAIIEIYRLYRMPPLQGKYEILIHNSLIALQNYHEYKPDKYETVSEEYFISLIERASAYEVNMNKSELRSFINSRFAFYLSEYNNMLSDSKYLLTKIFNNFYFNPLQIIPRNNEDMFEFLEFLPAYHQMRGWIELQSYVLFGRGNQKS